MREKLLTWSGKSLVVALLLLAGLCFGTSAQAQSLTTTATVQGTWHDGPTAIGKLEQQIQTLDAAIQAPPAAPSLAFIKGQRWYYAEILTAIQGGETVPKAVEIGQNKLGAVLQPDTPNPDLSPKDFSDLFQSAVTLLTY